MAQQLLSGVPKRDYMDSPDIKWKEGKPNYDQVNRKYMKEKVMNHADDSLEKLVENLVKTWEMESSHKIDVKDWGTVDKEKFFINANGGKKFSLADNIEIGNYNMMLYDCPLYNAEEFTNEQSHSLFRTTFPSGFPWEVLAVQSGPPVVSFTWRHWGTWEGKYGEVPPSGETLEMFGSGVVNVNKDLKIESIEIYYDPNPVIAKLSNFKRTTCPFKS